MLDRLPGVRKRGCSRAIPLSFSLVITLITSRGSGIYERWSEGWISLFLSLSSSHHLEKDRGRLNEALVLIFPRPYLIVEASSVQFVAIYY